MKVSTHPLLHRKASKQVIRVATTRTGQQLYMTLRAYQLWIRSTKPGSKWLKVQHPPLATIQQLNSWIGYEFFPQNYAIEKDDF